MNTKPVGRKQILKARADQMASLRHGIYTLTVRECCDLLSLSESSIRKYIESGALKRCKEGPKTSRKRVFIYLDSLQSYIDTFQDKDQTNQGENTMNKTTIETKPTIETKAIIKKDFNQVPVEFRQDDNETLWITAQQLGKALGYTDPANSINRIINRHKDILVEFTSSVKLTDKPRTHDTTVISEMGANIICMKANTPIAKDFIKWAAKIITEYRHGRLEMQQTVNAIRKFPPASLILQLRKSLDAKSLKLWLEKTLDIPVPPADRLNHFLEVGKITIGQVMHALNETHHYAFWESINTGNCDKEKVARLMGVKVEDIW